MKMISGAFALIVAAASVSQAQVLIDMQGISPAGVGGTCVANGYTNSGFVFTNSNANTCSFGTWNTADASHPTGGIDALFNNYGGAITTLFAADAHYFSIASIDLATVFANGGSSVVTFTGLRSDATTVSQSFSVPGASGSPTLATYYFNAGFTNLQNLKWAQTPNYHQFDNLAMDGYTNNVAPEPASMVLLATGLIGVGAIVRKRNRK